ncbi:hypothetical protein H257_18686 [Aphanomyces astaci]|uniref:Uncharacterized protein n=1 Tax=Aphanomyces astaci TaxID=112090 RepID=W4FCG6_APHAT|nr:hypothetical protein H257_18686 [Aphanomyces astaci]ETV64423.1 hypothetical protein H257_18686 [Aphanomyces astaci]|eukprot:XP_009846090.1 hypothetical protein H257_18686 [Aphanomyces astaci]
MHWPFSCISRENAVSIPPVQGWRRPEDNPACPVDRTARSDPPRGALFLPAKEKKKRGSRSTVDVAGRILTLGLLHEVDTTRKERLEATKQKKALQTKRAKKKPRREVKSCACGDHVVAKPQSTTGHAATELESSTPLQSKVSLRRPTCLTRALESESPSTSRLKSIKLDVAKFGGAEFDKLLRWILQVSTAADAQRISNDATRVAFCDVALEGHAADWAFSKRLTDRHCYRPS